MNDLSVKLERHGFEPGDEVAGRVSWTLDSRPEAVVVRLCWRTSGRGTTDVRIADEKRWVGPPAESFRPFQLRLPREPFSFSGQLISLTWTVEVVAEPSDASDHQDLVMAPGGREIVLAAVPKVIARENPFRTERLEALSFRFLEGDWDELWSRLAALERAALVGPCGSGKTTLLHELARRLPARGLRPHLVVAPEEIPRGLGASDALLIDGGERLPARQWRLEAPEAALVIVTQHRPGPLPTLLDLRTTPALLAALVAELAPGHAVQAEVGTLFARSGGDLRQALLAFYDRFAESQAPGPNSP